MLQAAADYQSALANPRSTDIATFTSHQISDIYKTARDKGWILAGSYYTLLQEQIKTEQLVDTYFRLTAYSTDSASGVVTETSETNASANRPLRPSNAFFTNYTDGAENHKSSLRDLFNALDVSGDGAERKSIIKDDTRSSNETLRRAFAWVYFSSPYAKILGKTLEQTDATAGQAGAAANKGISFNPATMLSYEADSEGWIDARVYGGSALVAVPIVALAGIGLLKDAPMIYLQYDVNQIMKTWTDVMGGTVSGVPVKDPIVKLQILGRSMITHSVAFFTQIERIMISVSTAFMIQGSIETLIMVAVGFGSFWGATTGASMALQGMQSLSNSINEIVRTIIFMYVPIGLAVTGPLLVTGITLAVYVPLIPYMLFLFGVMSWFISVLVLMAAAPIICFLMLWGSASQENPLLSREAEQFVQQIISVFFRPTLMVVGLVVGVILARIGVDLLNAGFQTITKSIFEVAAGSVNAQSGDSTVRMIEQIGTVVIYTFVMVSLVNLCFSTIYLLHSEVMGIVGIRVTGGGEEKAMAEVKGGVTEFSQAGAAGGKEQATALKGLQSAGPKAMSAGELHGYQKEDEERGKKKWSDKGKNEKPPTEEVH